MQFKLSTLMVMVAAVALGFMGWQAEEWMKAQTRMRGDFLDMCTISVCFIMLLSLMIVGGRSVVYACLLGFVAYFLLLWWQTDAVSQEWFWDALHVVIICCMPLALFTGSLRFAFVTNEFTWTRFGFLLPSCFILCWHLHIFVNHF